jgi:hypothetical protein
MPAGGRAGPFDVNKLNRLMNETFRHQDWLAARKATDQTVPFQMTQVASTTASISAQSVVLDVRHKTVLREILTRSTWPAPELRTITSRLGLMPWACVAKLNLWTTETFGDLLLEGEEIVNVNKTLMEKIRV